MFFSCTMNFLKFFYKKYFFVFTLLNKCTFSYIDLTPCNFFPIANMLCNPNLYLNLELNDMSKLCFHSC